MTTIEITIGAIALSLVILSLLLLFVGLVADSRATHHALRADYQRFERLDTLGYQCYTIAGFTFTGFMLLAIITLFVKNILN